MDLRRVVGISIHSARIRSGMTLREVSARSGVALGYLSELERGRKKEPSSEVVDAILRGLNLTLEGLLRDCLWRVAEDVVDPFQDPWWDTTTIETRHGEVTVQ